MINGIAAPILSFASAIITAVIGGVLTYVIYERYRQSIRVRRITKPNDNDLDDYFNLYTRLFRSEVRSSPADTVRWLSEYQLERRKRRPRYVENVLIAKSASSVVGFLKFVYYRDSQYLFLSYCGIDKRIPQARSRAAAKMFTNLIRIVRHEFKGCRGIVFEIDRPNHDLDPHAFRVAEARKQLFQAYARKYGYVAYEILIDYVQPILDVDFASRVEGHCLEVPMCLMYIPFVTRFDNHRIEKEQVLEILRFIYLEIYGDSFNDGTQRNTQYYAYLASLLDRYTDSLDISILLRS